MKSAFVSALIFCLWAAVAFVVRCHNFRDVVLDSRFYFTDGDCYSRMTRAALIDAEPGKIIHHQDFENYPRGTNSHATAPMDYSIVVLKWFLNGLLHALEPTHSSKLEGQTLDLAGALISPLLGAAACGFLALFARSLPLSVSAGWTMPFFWAVSPIVVHGTLLGRPDHQSLQMAILAVALAAEIRLAGPFSQRQTIASVTPSNTPSDLATAFQRGLDECRFGRARCWAVTSGISWGLALWVSLYEPAVLLILVIALWLIFKPRALVSRDRLIGWAALVVILGIALLVEGWPVELPDAAMRPFLVNWSGTIGELQHVGLLSPLLYHWFGAGFAVVPALLWFAYKEDRRVLPAALLLAAVTALTCWQIRWGYFLALVFALTAPWQFAVFRRWRAAPLAVAASLWPMYAEWEGRLFPDPTARNQSHLELTLLRQTAEDLRSPQKTPFLAPWWTSPAIAYWSGQPGVSGTSHEAISGTVDSARFYLAATPAAAAAILEDRGVSRVFSDDPQRIIHVCAPILGIDEPIECMATLLADRSHNPAPYLIPVFTNDYYKVFAVDPHKLKP